MPERRILWRKTLRIEGWKLAGRPCTFTAKRYTLTYTRMRMKLDHEKLDVYRVAVSKGKDFLVRYCGDADADDRARKPSSRRRYRIGERERERVRERERGALGLTL